MPMGTLELPRSMIDAAETYAECENLTVADLFADLLHSRYGYSITLTVSRPQAPVRRKRVVSIPDSIKSISGIVSLPEGQTEDDIICEVCTPSEFLAEETEQSS